MRSGNDRSTRLEIPANSGVRGAERIRTAVSAPTTEEHKPLDAGVIYAIQSELGGPIKIGWVAREANLEQRVRSLQTGHPYPLRIIWTQAGALQDEIKLHRLFGRRRLCGEWFTAAPDVAEFFGAKPSLDQWLPRDLYNHAFDHGWQRGYDDGRGCGKCPSPMDCTCPEDSKGERRREKWDEEYSWGLLA